MFPYPASRPAPPRFWQLLPLALALLLLSACGDEPLPTDPQPPQPPVPGVFEGRLVDPLGVSGLDSLRLALLELDSMSFVAQGFTSDLGYFRLDQLPAGDYVPVIYGGNAILLELPQTSWPLTLGDTARVELRATRVDPGTPEVSGVVVDAISGELIPGASIEIGPTFVAPERFGLSSQHRQLSDPEGFFELRDFLILQLPDGGLIPDLLCTAPGYLGYRRTLALEELPAQGLRLELQPGTDRAQLSGRVVDLNGEPLGGIPITVDWISRPEFTAKAGDAPPERQVLVPGRSTLSQLDGSYLLEGLPAGFYQITVGYKLDDGWLRIDSQNLPEGLVRPRIQINEGESARLGDVASAPAIRPLTPIPDALVGPQPDFSWEAWSFLGSQWATGYRIVIAPFGTPDDSQWLTLAPIPGEELAWPDPDTFLPPGRHAWRVDVIGGLAGEGGFMLFESWAHFEVPLPESTLLRPDPADPRILRELTNPTVTLPAAGASGP